MLVSLAGSILLIQVQPQELAPMKATLEDRDSAIRNGLHVQGKRYEVLALPLS